jgi:hypothetical protein
VLRDRFFPGKPIVTTLEHVVLERGRVARRSALANTGGGTEGLAGLHSARFHAGEDGTLWAILAVTRRDADRTQRVENQVRRVWPERAGAAARLDLKEPFLTFFTATERGGSLPSHRLDLFGVGYDPTALRYARVRLSGPRRP